MSFAMTFPGQGSQSVGMLADLGQAVPEVMQTFEQASASLGYDLWQLIQNGPEEVLGQTDRTQPALLAAGVSVFRAWRSRGGPMPQTMAGHSLGEYTALVCAGRLGFEDAIALVRFRGEIMQAAVPPGAGAMAAILGLDDEEVISACAEASGRQVEEGVNFNEPGQVVIAGDSAAVDRAVDVAKKRGARRAIVLQVSVPSHCSLRRGAADRLGQRLADVSIESSDLPVFHNVDASPHSNPDEIRAALSQQLYRPVRWTQCINAMHDAGARTFAEAGPGKVLTGLMRRIDRSLEAISLHDEGSLASGLSQMKSGDEQ